MKKIFLSIVLLSIICICGVKCYAAPSDWGVPWDSNISIKGTTYSGHSSRGIAFDFAKTGTVKLYAPTDGTIAKMVSYRAPSYNTYPTLDYGNYIQITTNDGYTVIMAHMMSIDGNVVVKGVGGKVAKGEFIGYMGNTGCSTGQHLHFEIIPSANNLFGYTSSYILSNAIKGAGGISSSQSYLDIGDDFDAYIMSPHYDDLYVTNISSNVLMKNYTGGKNQIWHFSRDTDGNYKITNRSDKQCLDVSGTTKGANICTQVGDNSDSQRWNLSEQNGAYIITSKESENVLDISGYGNAGDNVQLWVKNSTVNQQFEIKKLDEISGVDIGTNFYATMISPYYENLCVTNNNENAVLNVFLDSLNQKYLFERNEDDSYKIKSLSTSTYLHTDGTGNGANVEFREKENLENQDWWLNGPVDGMVLTSKACDYALDISGSGNDGDNLQLWKLNSGANQVFSVNKLDLPSLLSVNFESNGKTIDAVSKTSYSVNSINGIRGEDQLVIFNQSGSSTGTNIYGTEVLVDSNNQVKEVIVRVGNATVPSGGFILSGNRNAQYWIEENVSVGDYVLYDESSNTVSIYNENEYLFVNKKVQFGNPYGALPIPTRSGYVFDGWYTSATDGTKIESDIIVTATEDITLYAHWRKRNSSTSSTVTKSENTYTVKTNMYDMDENCKIFICGYKGGEMVDFKKCEYNSAGQTTTLSGDIDEIRVISFESLTSLNPLCEEETILSSKWVIQ